MVDGLLPFGDLIGKELPCMVHPLVDFDLNRHAGPAGFFDKLPDIGEEELVGTHLDIEPGQVPQVRMNRRDKGECRVRARQVG